MRWDNPRRRVASTGGPLQAALLDLIYPQDCLACGAGEVALARRLPGGWQAGPAGGSDGACLCERCFSALPLIGQNQCPRCGEELGPFAEGRLACQSCAGWTGLFFRGATAVCRYEGVAREMVHQFKYARDIRAVAWMGQKMLEKLQWTDWFSDCDLLVPVPLHWTRRVARRFNQSALLAQAIARASGKALLLHVLRRVKRTTAQAILDRDQRELNVKGAFRAVRPGRVEGKRVVLVDDVMSTSATARECARVLMAAGSRTVHVAVYAR